MTVDDTAPVLHVPARDIPMPTHISPQAQAMLARGPGQPFPDLPLDDLDAWRKKIAEMDENVLAMTAGTPAAVDATVEEVEVDGAHVYVITPQGIGEDDRRVFLDVHGGAYVLGGGAVCRHTGLRTARRVGSRTWAVDYRMPPDHPFPAGLDDCVAAYTALLSKHRPSDIIVGGGSAGGNLASALLLRVRDEGLPLPAAAVLLTPAVDFTGAGDTRYTNFGIDTVLSSRTDSARDLYTNGHDLRDPLVSPIYGDFSKGFPPTILASGTRDVLLSDTVRLHRALRRAGIPAELHVLEAAPHGWFFGTAPEDAELDAEIKRFVDEHWRR
jgi:monoterpene epsilon-lactone hydrolase